MNRHIASIAVVSVAALTVGVGGALAQGHNESACGRFSFNRDACLGNRSGSGSTAGTVSTTRTERATGSSRVSTDTTTQFPSASPATSDDKTSDDKVKQDDRRPHGSRE